MASASPARRGLGYFAKQAGLFVLFGTILMIPRLRRLRRRVWAWTGVRLVMTAGGALCLWHIAHARAEITMLPLGMILVAAGLLIRAKPEIKSADALAGELDALVVLNGGALQPSPDSVTIPETRIFVHPERILALGSSGRRLLEIPFATVKSLAANPATDGPGAKPWKVEIRWADHGVVTFRYDGVFAEHLARVAESTLRSQWKKQLPVILS